MHYIFAEDYWDGRCCVEPWPETYSGKKNANESKQPQCFVNFYDSWWYCYGLSQMHVCICREIGMEPVVTQISGIPPHLAL